jgi:hypothetical protein
MHTQTKILIYLAVWKRPLITELCFAGIERLRRSFNIEALAVISEVEMIPLCEKYDIHWVMYKNDPLGEKKNYGLMRAAEYQFDYLMEIGSDDLILDELVQYYLDNCVGKFDFFGVTDALWLDTKYKDCRRIISRTTYGAGRMISRKGLDDMGWKLWNDRINRGMDNNSVFNAARKSLFYTFVPELSVPCVIDVKSDENIWQFDCFRGVEYDFKKVECYLSEEEKNLLEQCYSISNS